MSDVSQILTWATLLARWTDFARSAVALPREGEGGRLRQAVPSLIGLQAVTHALAELDRLPELERSVGLDRAEVLIGRYDAAIGAIWAGEPRPDNVSEFVTDANAALEGAKRLLRPSAQ
jgi:DNA-binding transcriptional LysR family regulator